MTLNYVLSNDQSVLPSSFISRSLVSLPHTHDTLYVNVHFRSPKNINYRST